jgi:hypothetical protein
MADNGATRGGWLGATASQLVVAYERPDGSVELARHQGPKRQEGQSKSQKQANRVHVNAVALK